MATNLSAADCMYRPLSKEEALLAHQFISEFSEGNFHCSLQSLIQHCHTILICQSPDNEWLGIAVTYLSPSAYSTAAIEGIVVKPLCRRQGFASLLLAETILFWKNKCVFNFSVIATQLPDGVARFLARAGFKPIDGPGFTQFTKKVLPQKICVHNRRMRPSMNTINGEVSEETLFEYYQDGDIIWGTYGGGQVVRGVLLGRMNRNGNIAFQYMQHSKDGGIYTGTSKSTTEFLNDGRIVLYEDWEWTGNRSGGGRSVIEEEKHPVC